MVGAPHPILVDTSSLIAFCKTSYDEFLFGNLAMTTSNICNEEVKRQKGPSDELEHRTACQRYIDLLSQEKNPDIHYTGDYKPYVEDQGEKSLEDIFRHHPDAVDYILLFDFDAIESFEELKSDLGGSAVNTKISLPNHAFELLRQGHKITDDEYCKATYQIGCGEGWMKKHAQKFDAVSPIDCPQFP
jgi:hypothetical protein